MPWDRTHLTLINWDFVSKLLIAMAFRCKSMKFSKFSIKSPYKITHTVKNSVII